MSVRVRCIDNKDSSIDLIEGREYEASEHAYAYCYWQLRDVKEAGGVEVGVFLKRRFEVVKEEAKPLLTRELKL